MCAQKYPYQAEEIEELEQKVLTQKYQMIPMQVQKEFNLIIKQCLQKKPENRPTIDQIIFRDDFQQKAKVNKITLPRNLNKDKLMSLLKLRKPIPQEDRQMLLDLAEKGFLPQKQV